jgi:hypothetical protein
MAKVILPDELWEVIEPLLPPEPAKFGQLIQRSDDGGMTNLRRRI